MNIAKEFIEGLFTSEMEDDPGMEGVFNWHPEALVKRVMAIVNAKPETKKKINFTKEIDGWKDGDNYIFTLSGVIDPNITDINVDENFVNIELTMNKFGYISGLEIR